MNQPRFKVGETVYSKAWKCKFTVTAIRISKSGIFYCDDDTDYAKEDECEPFQEPQKKKLYAFSYYEEVKFSYHERPLWSTPHARAPEYDIDYPLNHSSKE